MGPEPTTDRFIALMHGKQDGVIPGHAVAVDPSKPFMSLGDFGSAFLQRFQISLKDSPVLRSLNIIDSPGMWDSEVAFKFNSVSIGFSHSPDIAIYEKPNPVV